MVSDPSDIIEIDAEKLKRMLDHHVAFVLIDLRDEVHFEAGHIKNAFRISPQDFISHIKKSVPKKETPLVIYDQDGTSAKELVKAAGKKGFLNVVNLEGGFLAYQNLIKK